MNYIVGLTDVKDRLQIVDNSQDTFLLSLIENTTQTVEGYCGRSFTKATTHVELLDVDSTSSLNVVFVKNTPIVEILSLKEEGVEKAKGSYFIYKDIGAIKVEDTFKEGLQILEVKYTAGYEEVPDAIKAVGMSLVVGMYSKAGVEGVGSETIGDYSVTYRDPLYVRYSTEWSAIKDILDKYKKVDSFT